MGGDVIVSLGVYAMAEESLAATEALRRAGFALAGDRAAPHLATVEERARAERRARGLQLQTRLRQALDDVEHEPGGGWFVGDVRKKVRKLAVDLRSQLAPPARVNGRGKRPALTSPPA